MSPTPRKRLWRWLTDWRNGLTFIASCVLALFAVFILDSINARNDAQDQAKAAVKAAESATDAQRSSAERASRRITQLQSEIARNRGDIDALREQIVGLGVSPTVPIRTDIVSAPTTSVERPSSPAASRPTPSTSPPSTAGGGTPPPTSPSPTTRCLGILGRCLPLP